MRGLYVHIPFCLKKCFYCDFVITTDRTAKTRQRFFRSLRREIEFAKSKFGKLSFDTLYLGGGTPSLLSPDEMSELLGVLRSEFKFQNDYELTCEINPENLDADKLQQYQHLGINRASVGAQSFNDELLRKMGRTHSSHHIVRAIELLQKTGFQNISIDFILKLPRQTIADVKDSIQRAISLGAKQISLYDLDVHEKTVYGLMQKQGKLHLPSGDEHEQMFGAAELILNEAGFHAYEVSNFALPGFESKHNLIYWHNQEYLGLGPGAYSYLGGVRYQFASDVEHYLQKCEAGDFTNDTEDLISPEEREIENLMTGLRLQQGIDLEKFTLTKPRFSEKLKLLAENHLILCQDNRVSLTTRGRFMCETVIQHLIRSE